MKKSDKRNIGKRSSLLSAQTKRLETLQLAAKKLTDGNDGPEHPLHPPLIVRPWCKFSQKLDC
jgi:hypothetical protein